MNMLETRMEVSSGPSHNIQANPTILEAKETTIRYASQIAIDKVSLVIP
jgi:hypothetical protein